MTAISEAERARRQSEVEQRRVDEASECASLRAQLEALLVELTERWHAELTAISEALAKRTNEVIDQVEMLNKRWHAELTAINEALAERTNEVLDQVVTLNERLQTELCNLVKTQMAALRARVDGVLPDTKSALRVARERVDEVSELPNPLPPRRTIN
jgi:hypothetical protein